MVASSSTTSLDRHILNYFFQQIEAALLSAATQFAPEGTEPKAVAHQWIHALAYGYTPFAAKRGASASNLIEILKKAQLYTDALSFKNKLPSLVYFKKGNY